MFYSIEERKVIKKSHNEKFEKWLDSPKTYAIVPEDIIFSNELSEGEKMFYVKLTMLSDKKDGTLLHSNDTLAKKLGCGIPNVKKHLDSLKKKGLLLTLSTGPHNLRYICLTPYNQQPKG